MNNKILITGASGNLGGGVLDHLIDLLPPAQLVAAGRNLEAMARFAGKGVSVRSMDFDDGTSIEQALADIGTLYLVPTREHDRVAQHRRVLEAAKHLGVKHVLYSGVIHHDEEGFGAAVTDHQTTERDIAATGLQHTFVRNGIYLDALPMLMGNAVESGAFAYPVAPKGVSWAASADLSEATARIIADPTLHGGIHALSLSRAVDYTEIAAIVSQATGRSVAHVDVSPEAYEQVLVQVGVPPGLAGFLAGLAVAMAQGVVLHPNDALKRILGREPLSAEAYLRSVLVEQAA